MQIIILIVVLNNKAPFTGRNIAFRQSIVGNKPYCFVLNKADLADLSQKDKIVEKLALDGFSPCFFTNLRDSNDKTTRKVILKLF